MAEIETARPLVVVMGVAGCGKSTIGAGIAERLGVAFMDGDDLHPLENVTKMSAGIPLTDADRWPWLRDVGRALNDHHPGGLVVACSALRRVYRTTILREAPDAIFVHLQGSASLIGARLARRDAHFMPLALLQSQFETLEPLADDEPGFTVGIGEGPDDIVDMAVRGIAQRQAQAAHESAAAATGGARKP